MKLETVKLLGNKILCKKVRGKEETRNGIYIPQAAEMGKVIGDVVAVGDCYRDQMGKTHECTIRVGDRVVILKQDAEVRIDGQTLILTNEMGVMYYWESKDVDKKNDVV